MPELVVNGDFADGSNWSFGANWAAVGGVARTTSGSAYEGCRQLLSGGTPIAIGTAFNCSLTLLNKTANGAGAMRFWLAPSVDTGGLPNGAYAYPNYPHQEWDVTTAVTTMTFSGTTTATAALYVGWYTSDNALQIQVDNVSVITTPPAGGGISKLTSGKLLHTPLFGGLIR